MTDCFQKLIIKLVPLAVYLEQLSAIVITKGVTQIDADYRTGLVQMMYYGFLGSIYGVQILRVLINKCFQGYSRGSWFHIITTVQLIVQVVLVIGVIAYISKQPNFIWIWWEFAIIVGSWAITVFIRFIFIMLICIQVFGKKGEHIELKETFWLMMTSKQELFENKGQLCHDPRQNTTIDYESFITSEEKH